MRVFDARAAVLLALLSLAASGCSHDFSRFHFGESGTPGDAGAADASRAAGGRGNDAEDGGAADSNRDGIGE